MEEGAPQHANELANHNCNFYPAQSPRFDILVSAMTRSLRLRRGKPRPAGKNKPSVGRGAWMIPLLGRSALQLIENQLAMLLECAEAFFERVEQ